MSELVNVSHYISGIFKVCHVYLSISAHDPVNFNTRARWFSYDRGSAKQLFTITKNNESVVLHKDDVLLVVCEFPDVDVEPIKQPLSRSTENMSYEWVIPNEILGVGTTRMIQHLYLLQHTGGKNDIGKIHSTITSSLIENLPPK